tara:strand:+ start:310 stop:1032 length:723 start_codon:yes stop_codon:yes gene_type:complete
MSLDKKLMDVAQAYLSMHEKAKTEDASNDKSDDGDGMDKVDPKAAKKKFKDRKDKDLDNDGDTDGSDEYLHKRRKAIASKSESKQGFIMAAKKAKDAGEKEFVFAGKKYNCEEVLSKKEAVEIEVDDKSDASPEMDKKDDPKKKKKKDPKVSKAKDDDKGDADSATTTESVDTSPAGDSPPAKRASVRDKGLLDMLRNKTVEKRRDEDKQDGTNAAKESPKRPGDSKVGEKAMKKFKEMR